MKRLALVLCVVAASVAASGAARATVVDTAPDGGVVDRDAPTVAARTHTVLPVVCPGTVALPPLNWSTVCQFASTFGSPAQTCRTLKLFCRSGVKRTTKLPRTHD